MNILVWYLSDSKPGVRAPLGHGGTLAPKGGTQNVKNADIFPLRVRK